MQDERAKVAAEAEDDVLVVHDKRWCRLHGDADPAELVAGRRVVPRQSQVMSVAGEDGEHVRRETDGERDAYRLRLTDDRAIRDIQDPDGAPELEAGDPSLATVVARMYAMRPFDSATPSAGPAWGSGVFAPP